MALAEFMKELVDFSLVRYAVIEALKIDADPERFVIAYRTEQALHDVIAAPSIIAPAASPRAQRLKRVRGFASRRLPLKSKCHERKPPRQCPDWRGHNIHVPAGLRSRK